MDKSSKYRGVSKKKGKWEAKVMVNRRWAYRELFDSEEAAARAYDMALWRLKPAEAASYVNFKDDLCGVGDDRVAGASQARGGFGGIGVNARYRIGSMESAECEDEYPLEDACDQEMGECYYSSDGDFEYEYKPTKGTSRSEKMRANKASASASEKDLLSLRKSAPAPVRTKKGANTMAAATALQPTFAMVPGEGMKFFANSAMTVVGAGTSLESASTPLGVRSPDDQGPGMIPNVSTSSFHDQEDLIIRVGSETHLVPPSSNALPMHNDPCVGHGRGNNRHFQPVARLPAAGMKRATSEPYIASLHDFTDPLEGIDDLMNDADVLGGGVDLGLLSAGFGTAGMGSMVQNAMDTQDMLNIQSFVNDQASKQNQHQSSHLVFDEAEEVALSGLEFQPKPRKLSKSVSMTNLACEDVSAAAVAANGDGLPTCSGRGSGYGGDRSFPISGRPPAMPKAPLGGFAAANAPSVGAGLRRINTFTCSLPSLDEADIEQTPRLRASSHNSSDEDLVKQLWAGEACIPSLHPLA